MDKSKIKFLVLPVIILFGSYIAEFNNAEADTAKTATLRIMATGDLHGQVTSTNYETGQSLPKKGLSKIATLVLQKEKEAGANNTLLVDAGDFLYDYSTNFFYDNDRDDLQPILKAMSVMDYDYITLGNHEFDYPWDYLTSQLKEAGFADKVLLCNTIWHDSGKQVFNPSAVVTKYLSASDGKVIPVKIGIIGATTNSISTRREDYLNVIDANDNYDSIVAEANRLKTEEKVAAVIVILHGGIGTKEAAKQSDNIGYDLTKAASIDAVVAAHTHSAFPDEKEAAQSGISMKNVDFSTGCISGKPVVEAASHAGALGIIDLTFNIAADGSVNVSYGNAEVSYVTENVKENSEITDLFDDYQKKLQAGADTAAYKIANGITYHNYDTVLQDSNLYQLLNNAKLEYGLTYISENRPEYKNIPVIACTRNLLDSNENYLLMDGTLSAEKISGILSETSSARPAGYIRIFEITGKALREWLEYNASIYAIKGTTFNKLLKTYESKNPGVSTLLQENYVYNWNSQYIFDGISYTVDLSKKARFSTNGVKLNSKNKRITDLTCNGMEVTDSQRFILVTDSGIPTLSCLPVESDASIKEIRDYETGKNITMDYIRKMSVFGNISVKADNNWSLTAGRGYSFLLGVPKTISASVAAFSWSKGLVGETASYSFFKGSLPTVKQTINIVAAQGRTEVNSDPVPVIISATSKYAIKEIKYAEGKLSSASDAKWNTAATAENNVFETSENGLYTIKVTDKNNNSSIAYITVDRYNADILKSPVLNTLTNRYTSLTGKAAPGSAVHVTIGSDTYTSAVKSDGIFYITIKPAKAFSQITAYSEAGGLKSASVTAYVRKTGPDAVELNRVSVGSTYVTGTTSPDNFVYALIWSTIYVGRGQTKAYQNSEFYKASYKIVETDITIDQTTGAYRISLPYLKSNMKVFVFAVDRFGLTSKSTMLAPM